MQTMVRHGKIRDSVVDQAYVHALSSEWVASPNRLNRRCKVMFCKIVIHRFKSLPGWAFSFFQKNLQALLERYSSIGKESVKNDLEFFCLSISKNTPSAPYPTNSQRRIPAYESIQKTRDQLHSQIECVLHGIEAYGKSKKECPDSIRSYGTRKVYSYEAHKFGDFLIMHRFHDIFDSGVSFIGMDIICTGH